MGRQHGQPVPLIVEERIASDHECIDPLLHENGEGGLEIALMSRVSQLDSQAESARGGLCGIDLRFGGRIVRIDTTAFRNIRVTAL